MATNPQAAPHAIDLYDGYAGSVLVPFVAGSGIDSLSGPDTRTDRLRLNVSIDGQAANEYVVDTGSLGVAAPSSDFTAAQLAAGTDGYISYDSSNIKLLGKWVTTTLSFTDAAGGPVTETMPILAVTSVVNATTGAPTSDPIPRMLGVKYAPPKLDLTLTVANNPFLNLPGMQAGTMRAGYTITDAGITLGLTAAQAGDGWAYSALQPSAAGTGTRLWQTAAATITAAGGAPTRGTQLIDTGLTRGFINGSGSTAENVGRAGTPVAIDLLGTGTGTVGYAFTTGGADPWTPSSILHVEAADFINTGSRALLAMDYLVDATGGFIGFRAKPNLGPGVSFTPALALGGPLDPVQAFTTSLPVILRDGTAIAAGTAVTLGAVSGAYGLTVPAGATLILSASGTYSGGTTLAGGQLSLAVSGAAGSGGIAFAAGTASTLSLAAGAAPANAITGLDADDVLDLQGFDAATSTASYDGTTLRVDDAAGHGTQLALATDPTARFVRLARDAGGTGVAVSFDQAPCYCPGTLILTGRGEVPVEALAIGDQLVTGDGTLAPLVWIGRRSYAGRFVTARPGLLPIRIRAGALGAGLPRRDLYVSPLHAMLLDGQLVPAGLLVNGRTIQRVGLVAQLDYLHLELPRHAVIWAEGAASESFLDDGSRAMFHNAAEHAALHPDAPAPGGYCAPRLEGGPGLIALRRRLAGLAAAAGRAA